MLVDVLKNFVLNQGAEITLSESAFLNEVKEQKLDFKNISLMVMHGFRADPSTHISPPPLPCDSGLQDYLTNFLGPNMLKRRKIYSSITFAIVTLGKDVRYILLNCERQIA